MRIRHKKNFLAHKNVYDIKIKFWPKNGFLTQRCDFDKNVVLVQFLFSINIFDIDTKS